MYDTAEQTAPELSFTLQPKQGEAYFSIATEILYGGAAGGGKSHLMRVTAIQWACMVPGIQIYLFRRNYGDLYKNHMQGPTSFPAMLHPYIDAGLVKVRSDNQITFWNGSAINLCHLQHKKDLIKYQGPEFHVLLMDELTHFTEEEYRFLRGRCRVVGLDVPPEFAGQLPRILCGTNPGGIGHNWVKAAFVDSASPMAITKQTKSEGGMYRQFIPALLEDNPALMEADPDYGERLEGLGNPALIKAMRTGDWNIVAGGGFDDVWGPELIIPRFPVPRSWPLFRTFDWGSSHPFSYGLWTVANGEDVILPDDSVFRPRSGSLVRVAEWYGTEKVGSNKGLKMSAGDIAKGIIELEEALRERRWIDKIVYDGRADGQIFNEMQEDELTIATKFENEGVVWQAANKSPGSRINGLQLVRERMDAVVKGKEEVGIYFMENCRAAITILPVLPRDAKKIDDIDTKSEDHVYDEIRYAVLYAEAGIDTDYDVQGN